MKTLHRYEATSLAEIADEFDARAKHSRQIADSPRALVKEQVAHAAASDAWAEASRILRATTLTPPRELTSQGPALDFTLPKVQP